MAKGVLKEKLRVVHKQGPISPTSANYSWAKTHEGGFSQAHIDLANQAAELGLVSYQPRKLVRKRPTHFHWCPKCSPAKGDRKCQVKVCEDEFEMACGEHTRV